MCQENRCNFYPPNRMEVAAVLCFLDIIIAQTELPYLSANPHFCSAEDRKFALL